MDPKDYLKNGYSRTEILDKNSSFIITSYYWGENNVNSNSIKGITYGEQANRLIDNCKKLKLNYNIVHFPIFNENKMYQIALGLKGEFIMNCLNLFPKYKVIFIDSDLQILQYPHLFDIDADCYFVNWNEYDTSCYNPYQIELPGGILGFSNTHGAKTMLKILNDYMIGHLELAEDKSMSGIISRHFMNTYLRCVWLPYNYMFMFRQHQYDASIGKYTKTSTLEKELINENYTLSDIVMIHEDFETGMLDDVFEKRVTKSRWPPNTYKQLGEKLRCQTVKYRNYVNFNLNKNQLKHYKKDFRFKEKENVYKNVMLKPIRKIKDIKRFREYLNYDNTYPIIVSLIDNDVNESVIDNFINKCKFLNLNYVIYNSSKDYTKINKPQLFHKILKKYKKNICFIDIYYEIKKLPTLLNVQNIDFMTINLNNTNIKSYLCSDMRILRTLNDNLYFFAYNNIVLEFLQIWNEFNHKNIKFQHKNLEYSFNISLAINKMRCYWFPKKYILGPILHFNKKFQFNFFNNNYPKNSSYRKITKSLAQCGLKPPLNHGRISKEHRTGSKRGTKYNNKYGKQFLQLS